MKTCNECGKEFCKGFLIEGGQAYYCSEKCLNKNYTKEQYNQMYESTDTDTCYTEWDPEEA